jgi:hypothetical protein
MKDYLAEYQALVDLHSEKGFSIEQLTHDNFLLWLKTPFPQKEYQTELETFKTAKIAKFEIVNSPKTIGEIIGYMPTQVGENEDLGIKYYLFLGEYPGEAPDFQGLVAILASRLTAYPDTIRGSINRANFNYYADMENKIEQYRALAKSRGARLPSTYKEFLARIEKNIRDCIAIYTTRAEDKDQENYEKTKKEFAKIGITDFTPDNVRKYTDAQDKRVLGLIAVWSYDNDFVKCLQITAEKLAGELEEIRQEQLALSSGDAYQRLMASIYKDIKRKPKAYGVDKDETAPSGSIKRAYFLWPELEEVTSGRYFDQEAEYNRAYGSWKKDRQEWLDRITGLNKDLKALKERLEGLGNGLILDTSSDPEKDQIQAQMKAEESELAKCKKALSKVDDRVNDLSLNVFTYAGKVYHNTNGNLIYRYVGGEYPGLPPQDNESLVEIFDHEKEGESIIMTKGDAFYFGTHNTKVDALFTSVLGETGSTSKRNESQALNNNTALSDEEKKAPSALYIENRRAELIMFGTQEGGRSIKRARQAISDIVPRLSDIWLGIPQGNGTKTYYRIFDSKTVEYDKNHNAHKCIGLNLGRAFINEVVLPNRLYYHYPPLYYKMKNQLARELILYASQQIALSKFATNSVTLKVSTIIERLPSLASYETYKESGKKNPKRDILDKLAEGISAFNEEAKGKWAITGDCTNLEGVIRIERIEPTDLVKLLPKN